MKNISKSPESIADRLRTIRRDLGMNQKEMSLHLGLGESTWQNYERELNIPGGEVLSKIAALGYNTDWIITGMGPIRGNMIREGSVQNNFDLKWVEKTFDEILSNKFPNSALPTSLKPFVQNHSVKIMKLATNPDEAIGMIKMIIDDFKF